MAQSEHLKIKGEVTLTATSEDGEVRQEVVKNLVVNEGLQVLAAKLLNTNGVPAKHAAGTLMQKTDLYFAPDRKSELYAYDISEIAIGTHDSPQRATDTYANQFEEGTKISKRWDNGKVDGVTPNNAFYVQADFDATSADTLQSAPGTATAIKEVLLYAAAYDSPSDINPNRKLIARTKLKNEEGFLKFLSDRLTVAWKLQIGA
jgi:hypothetical protein